MNIIENREVMQRLREAFPKAYINMQIEIIIYPARNSYFLLADVETELELKAKVLEWLSREACKSISRQSQKYHLVGINRFLATDFSRDEMELIYTYLGNRCNHAKTLDFIENGYDFRVLTDKHSQP